MSEITVGKGYSWECYYPNCIGNNARELSAQKPNSIQKCTHPLCGAEFLNGGKLEANDPITTEENPQTKTE